MNRNMRIKLRSILRSVLFIISCVAFLFSAYKIVTKLSDDKNSDDAYALIRNISQNSDQSTPTQPPQIYEITPISENVVTQEERLKSSTEKEFPKRKSTMNFTALREVSPNIIAWIKLEGTNIDYPVLQSDNNEFYLTHLYNGEYSGNGSIFADYRNSENFTDRNTVLYGHHMTNGKMFAALSDYHEQDFYNEHPVIDLYTPDGDYKIELIAGTIEDGNSEFIRFNFTDEEFLSFVGDLGNRSVFESDVNVTAKDCLVSLCTCSSARYNARLLLVGKLLKS